MGNFCNKHIDNIKKKYNIVAFWDNHVQTDISKHVYNFQDISFVDDSVKILVMIYSICVVSKVISQLKKMGVLSENILFGLNYFALSENDRWRIKEGSFILRNENIVYLAANGEVDILVEEDDDLNSIVYKFTRKKYPMPFGMTDLSCVPLNYDFAYKRGTPIMRYYIDQFLEMNRMYIQGNIMEIGDDRYTVKYGGERVKNSYILHVEGRNGSIKGDLESGVGIREDTLDCFILTQTLDYIYDLQNTAKNIVMSLKRGGVALVTVAGISQISRYDMDRWGHYWSFTDRSLNTLFADLVGEENVNVRTYGNVKTAILKLYGASAEELKKEELDYVDLDYQVLISAVVRKPY